MKNKIKTKNLLKSLEGVKQTRGLDISSRGVIDEENRIVEFSLSSEDPYQRGFGFEILGHDVSNINMSRLLNKAPLLLDHEMRDLIGVVESARIENRRIIVTARFSKNALATEIFNDVKDGIRSKISVGYFVEDMQQMDMQKDGIDQFLVTKWTPFESSVVGIPADDTIGIGRSLEVIEPKIEKENKRDDSQSVGSQLEIKIFAEVKKMSTETNTVVDLEKEKLLAVNCRNQQVQDILTMGEKFKKMDDASKFIGEGKSSEAFRAHILDSFKNDPAGFAGNQKPIAQLDMTEKELKQYSMMNAINALTDGNTKSAGFEKEISDEIAKKTGKSSRGFYVPYDYQIAKNPQKRAMSQGTNSAGGFTVQTDLLSLIDVLRNNMVVSKLGATFLTGLRDSIAIPRVTVATAGSWVAENSAASEGSVTLDQVSMTPKTVTANTIVSRKLRQQSSFDIDAFVFNELAKSVAIAYDAASFNGTGASNQPTGVRLQSGINTVATGTNGSVITWPFVVNMETEIGADNAYQGALAYVTNSRVIGSCKQVEKATSTGIFLIENSLMNGYNVFGTNQIPSNITKGSGTNLSTMLLGYWNDLLIGEWGNMEIALDTSFYSTDGRHRITVFQDYDVAVRHPESFCELSGLIA